MLGEGEELAHSAPGRTWGTLPINGVACLRTVRQTLALLRDKTRSHSNFRAVLDALPAVCVGLALCANV